DKYGHDGDRRHRGIGIPVLADVVGVGVVVDTDDHNKDCTDNEYGDGKKCSTAYTSKHETYTSKHKTY
ncbi:hypothetical protein AX774_g8246, partial [Zancudomyces culisetae]